jgi:hypothetical protein
LIDPLRTGIVGGESLDQIEVVALEQFAQIRLPPVTLASGSKTSFTPNWLAVPGISCMRPRAPLGEMAWALNPLSA